MKTDCNSNDGITAYKCFLSRICSLVRRFALAEKRAWFQLALYLSSLMSTKLVPIEAHKRSNSTNLERCLNLV